MKVELNKDWWGYDADVCGGTVLWQMQMQDLRASHSNRLQKVLPVYLQFRQATHRLRGLYRQKVLTP